MGKTGATDEARTQTRQARRKPRISLARASSSSPTPAAHEGGDPTQELARCVAEAVGAKERIQASAEELRRKGKLKVTLGIIVAFVILGDIILIWWLISRLL